MTRAMRTALRTQAGFTLTELLIACAMIGVVMAGLFSILASGQQTYLVGSNTVETQQELRLVIQRMTNEIRHAGYCPTCGTGSPAIAPFSALTGVSATGFTIQNDWDGTWTGAAGINTAATVNYTVVGGNGAVTTTPRGEQIIYAVAERPAHAAGDGRGLGDRAGQQPLVAHLHVHGRGRHRADAAAVGDPAGEHPDDRGQRSGTTPEPAVDVHGRPGHGRDDRHGAAAEPDPVRGRRNWSCGTGEPCSATNAASRSCCR